jgi:hypothetical protein
MPERIVANVKDYTKLNLLDQELIVFLANKISCIPRPVLRAFGVALVINIVCWFYDLAQFPLGDHDVGYQSGIPLLSGGRVGRWFSPVVYLFSGHVQIPVWTQLLAFSTQIAAGMCAAYLWMKKVAFLPLLAGGVLLSCMPTMADFYYYHWMSPVFTTGQLLMAVSLLTAIYPRGKDTRISRWRLAGSTISAVCALALYQSSVMTWSVLFLGAALMYPLREEEAGIKEMLGAFTPALTSFVAASLLYPKSVKSKSHNTITTTVFPCKRLINSVC